MAKFKLSRSNFTIVPEGRHTFVIDQVNYNEAFGKMELLMTADGQYKHRERFNLLNADGSTNDRAMNSFTFLAKCALSEFDIDEFDEQDLVGKMFDADITHFVSPDKVDDNGNPRKYVNMGRKYPCAVASDEPAEETSTTTEATADAGASVADLLASLGVG